MKNSRLRLSVLAEFSVYAVFGLLLGTGAVWMFAQAQLGEGNQVSSLTLKVHAGAAMAALVVLGALITHIRSGWRSRRNRISGLTLLLAILFLVITGYGLYYAGDEQLRSAISRWHAWIGLGLFGLLPAHVLIGRAWRRRREKRAVETQTRAPSRQSDSRTDLSLSSSARPSHSETPHHPE
jgi:hypothetical protein